jgi:cytochrome d ubiquinol oxidase subunit I
MALDGLLIARAQFAFTIGYHILWPAYSIGISGFIVILGILWLATGRAVYQALLRFWIHLFALGFAMGVVTGIVLSYEIGTNWSVFAERTSNVIGPFFTYEVLMAFFLEAGFIGIMLFGAERVGPRLHVLSCAVVALGAVISAFWILAANSWMQTPAGFTLAGGKFELASWQAAIFNPSFPYRFAHMVIAAYITGAFLVIGVSGLHLWRRQHLETARAGLSIGLWMALALVPAQLLVGDLHGRNTLDYQPIKVAAMEGDWETRRGQPLVLFAWPDEDTETNRYAVEIPALGSLILTHDWDGEVEGLKAVAPAERPPVAVVFFAFRLMVGIWTVLFAITICGALLRWRGTLFDFRWFGLACALTSPLPFVAILSGWIVTEVGRQPFVVYGQLRTADAISPVAAPAVLGSLALFVVVYAVLLLAFFLYAGRMILQGPQLHEPAQSPMTVNPGTASALIAAQE